jgi:hypothetical protein
MDRAALAPFAVVFALSAVFFGVVLACSSSGGGGSGSVSGYSATNCPNVSLLGNSASCTSCVESKCASELTSANSACSAWLACVCEPGTDAGACPNGPLTAGGGDGGAECTAAVLSVGACNLASCFGCSADGG